ncbi:hypothetical protein POX_b03047 [Penicillium oxalicum]|nr:hypothetical protein POX_b03047 [Penicillium oxalicum]KAI2793001.1 hypothetical protein POX_b03047 [Penicillium oxalicum]
MAQSSDGPSKPFVFSFSTALPIPDP